MTRAILEEGDMAEHIRLHEAMKHCEALGVQQRVEEFCVVAGVLLALRPRHVLEIGVYGGGSFALWCALASGRKIGFRGFAA